MALEVYWYDFVCFGIVGIAFFGALWVLWRKEEGSRTNDNTIYESILVSRPDSDLFVSALRRGHVSTSQLWTSCWRGMHPRWLLLTRFMSFVAMAGSLAWDIVDWDAMMHPSLFTIGNSNSNSVFGWQLSFLKEEEEKNTTKRICDNVVNIIEILNFFSFLLVCSFFVLGVLFNIEHR